MDLDKLELILKNLLTTKDVARILGVNDGTIRNLRSSGRMKGLDYIKIKHNIYYKPSDVEKFISNILKE